MMHHTLAIFRRDFKKFVNNPLIIVMTLIMPIMYLVVFGSAMGGTLSHIPVGVVQEDSPFTVTPLFSSSLYQLNHINQIDAEKQLDITVYTDENQAKLDLDDGKITAVILFPSSVSNDNAVHLYVDSSDSITPSLVEAALTQVLRGLKANNPVRVDRIYGNIKYFQFFCVSVIMMAIFFAATMGGGTAIIKDRENGIHEGYFVTPVKASSIVLGMIASCTIRAFVAGFTIFLIDIFISGIVLKSFQSFFLVVLVILIVSIGVTSFIVSMASRFSSQQAYNPILGFFNIILFFTSGAFYPVIGMPTWLRWITIINPEYYGVHALRSIVLKNQGLNVISVDLMALVIFSVIMIVLGTVTYKRTLD